MKRFTLALVPWMALAGSAFGQVRMADVRYTHFSSAPVRAFRVGDECFVPVETVSAWGWETKLEGSTLQVKAEGRELQLPMRVFSEKQTFPLRVAIEKLGGKSEWDLGTDTIHVFSELTSISFAKTRLSVASPLPFRPRASLLTNPGRVVIDLEGVRLGNKTSQALDGKTRVSQYRPDVVRVVVETDLVPEIDKIGREGQTQLDLDLAKVELPKVVIPPKDPEFPTTVPPITDTVIPVASDNGMPLQVQFENKERVSIRMPLGDSLKAEPIFSNPTPTTLQIQLPGAMVALPPDFKLTTDAVVATQVTVDETGTTLLLTLARPMAAEMVNQGGTVLVTLLKPDVGNGALAGKIIVVDPGHGGFDPGAQAGGVREKDINLKMGRLIADALQAEGATVIMTRSTDVFIKLDKRAEIANRNKADFFISTHINSSGKGATQSGTITFHHKGREIDRVLANCIHSELVKVNKMPNIGVWSDGRIYNSGFAVLRQTKMPGVLLELGFVNHPRDRARLVTQDFQRSAAAAVVRGLKVFLGNAQKE